MILVDEEMKQMAVVSRRDDCDNPFIDFAYVISEVLIEEAFDSLRRHRAEHGCPAFIPKTANDVLLRQASQ